MPHAFFPPPFLCGTLFARLMLFNSGLKAVKNEKSAHHLCALILFEDEAALIASQRVFFLKSGKGGVDRGRHGFFGRG